MRKKEKQAFEFPFTVIRYFENYPLSRDDDVMSLTQVRNDFLLSHQTATQIKVADFLTTSYFSLLVFKRWMSFFAVTQY